MKFSTFFRFFFAAIFSCVLFSVETHCSLAQATNMISVIGKKFNGKQDEFEKVALDWISEAINKGISFDDNQGPINVLNKLKSSKDFHGTIKTSIETLKIDLDKRNEKTDYVQHTDTIIGFFLSCLSEETQVQLKKEYELPQNFDPQENYQSLQERFNAEQEQGKKQEILVDSDVIKSFFAANFVDPNLIKYHLSLITENQFENLKITKIGCEWSAYSSDLLEACMRQGILGADCKKSLLLYCLTNCLGDIKTEHLFITAIETYTESEIKNTLNEEVIKKLLSNYGTQPERNVRELIRKVISFVDAPCDYIIEDIGSPFWNDFIKYPQTDCAFLKLLVLEKKIITFNMQFRPNKGTTKSLDFFIEEEYKTDQESWKELYKLAQAYKATLPKEKQRSPSPEQNNHGNNGQNHNNNGNHHGQNNGDFDYNSITEAMRRSLLQEGNNGINSQNEDVHQEIIQIALDLVNQDDGIKNGLEALINALPQSNTVDNFNNDSLINIYAVLNKKLNFNSNSINLASVRQFCIAQCRAEDIEKIVIDIITGANTYEKNVTDFDLFCVCMRQVQERAQNNETILPHAVKILQFLEKIGAGKVLEQPISRMYLRPGSLNNAQLNFIINAGIHGDTTYEIAEIPNDQNLAPENPINNNENLAPKSSLRLFLEENKTSIGVVSAFSFGILMFILWQKRGTLWIQK